MGNLGNFNANDFEPAGDFSPIPDGEYVCVFTASERKLTKKAQESGDSEDGELLELTLEVIEGPFKGRNLWDRINLKNRSEMAEKIGKSQLSSVCRAVGRMSPDDSSELHDIPFIAKVAIEARSDNGQPANRIKAYKAQKPAADPAPAAPATLAARRDPAPQEQRAPAPAAGGSRKAPWAR